MKKKIVFASVITLSLMLCACSSSKSGKVSDLENRGTNLLKFGDLDTIAEETYGDSDEDEEYDFEEEIVHEEPFYPSSFEGFTYKSTLNSLGSYTNLSYSLPVVSEPSEADIQQEIDDLLEMYGVDELTEENAQSMGYENVADVYAQVKEELTESVSDEYYTDAANSVLNQVIANSDFTIDSSDVSSLYAEQLASYEEMATYFGVTFEELCTSYFEMTLEDLEKELKDDCVNSIKISLIVDAIIKDANIDMASIWDKESSEMLNEYGFEDAWEYVDLYGDEKYLISEVRYKVAVGYLLENGNNTAK